MTYSVTSIGTSAFTYCSGLTSVIIPNSVDSINTSAFKWCSSLRHVYCYEEGCATRAYFARGMRPLNGVDGEEGIAHVALHVLVGVGVAVLLGHVPVEASDLGGCALRVEILILHLSRRR